MKNKAGAEVETVRAVLAATTEKHYKELMADKPMPLEPSQQDAKESIMALLKEQGPMAGMDLKKLVMDETGCSKRTVERAHTCLVKEKRSRPSGCGRLTESSSSSLPCALYGR